MDTTKKDETTPKTTTDDLGTSELEKVSGGFSPTSFHCDQYGNLIPLTQPNAQGWTYDRNTRKCVRVGI